VLRKGYPSLALHALIRLTRWGHDRILADHPVSSRIIEVTEVTRVTAVGWPNRTWIHGYQTLENKVEQSRLDCQCGQK